MSNIFSQPGLGELLQKQQRETLERDILREQANQYRIKAQQAKDPRYLKSQMPAGVREFEYFQGLDPEAQKRYLGVKRATPEEALMRKGLTFDPNTGRAMPIQGFGGALGDIERLKIQGMSQADAEAAAMKEEQTKLAATSAERQANRSKAENALLGFERDVKRNVNSIDKALKLISPWSAGYGSALSFLPESDARALNNQLTEIKARVGFDNLQRMRDNSPTGGALGQVSEMENRLLQAVEGTLDPAQSDQLRENLTIIRDLYPQVLAEKRNAFRQDYSNNGSQKPMQGGGQATPQRPTSDAIDYMEYFK